MTLLDGNALAGVLIGYLGSEPTLATLRCSGCGTVGALARTRVHTSPMGSVARCPHCDDVLVTVVQAPGGPWVGIPGARVAIDLE
ncbi:MAG: DUF6510 family protein [Curtobacterium sp.]